VTGAVARAATRARVGWTAWPDAVPLRALPVAWRGAALAIPRRRALILVATFAVLCAVELHLGLRGELDGTPILMGMVLLVVGLTQGLVARDLRPGVWALLFQRGAAPLAHFARKAALTVGLAAAVVAAGVLLVALVVPAARTPELGVRLLLLELWLVQLAAFCIGVSALVPRLDPVVVLIWLHLSMQHAAQVLTGQASDGAAGALLAWLYLPLPALAALRDWALHGAVAPAPAELARLAVFPALWLAAAGIRILVADRRELASAAD
jgi:hypothetical protein